MTLKEQLNEICINPNTGKLNSSRMGLPFFQKNYPSLVGMVLNSTKFYSDEEINFTKRIVLILDDKNSRLTCGTCNGEVDPMARGEDKDHPFKRYCCQVCSGKANKGMKIIRSEEHQAEINAKREATMIEKYGVAYNTQREEIRSEIPKQKYIKHSHINYALLEDKEQLSQMYLVMTSTEIGEIAGCDYSVVIEQLKKFDIPIGTTHSKISKPQRELGEFIKSFGFEIEYNKKIDGTNLDIDIFVPEVKLGIEYNGFPFHLEGFSPTRGKKYHQSKTLLCIASGVRLIHIFTPDFLERREILESIIKNALGKTDVKIYARNTVVKIIDKKIAATFLSENHLKGTAGCAYAVGLYHGHTLVHVTTFGLPRFNSESTFEVIRSASLIGTSVVGGFSKVLSLFESAFCSVGDTILSYADRSISEGNSYALAGFEKLKPTDPGYFYIERVGAKFVVHSRLKFQKSKLTHLPAYSEEKTEWTIMKESGYDRYWDCGNNVYKKVVA